jgi:hypothetical protein
MKKYLIEKLKLKYKAWLSTKSKRDWEIVLEYRAILNERYLLNPRELDVLQIQQ